MPAQDFLVSYNYVPGRTDPYGKSAEWGVVLRGVVRGFWTEYGPSKEEVRDKANAIAKQHGSRRQEDDLDLWFRQAMGGRGW